MSRGNHQVIVGDCMTELAKLPANHFHACMTSPPYFALRSYLPSGHPDKDKEIGSEPTPDEFVATMVTVFREVGRVLRDDGFLWVNLGDSYDAGGRQTNGTRDGYKQGTNAGTDGNMRSNGGVGAGQQLLMPHRVALALQADGWVLRDTVVWAKRSPMPSSQNGVRWERCRVKVASRIIDTTTKQGQIASTDAHRHRASPPHPDNGIKSIEAKWSPCPGCPKCLPNGGYVLRRGQGRTTTAHEYLFLFTKTNSYFWDMENCREAAVVHDRPSVAKGVFGGKGGNGDGSEMRQTVRAVVQKRIPRSVWTLSSEPTRFSHFATYPSELVRRCLMPLSPRGCCPVCGAQWAPVVEQVTEPAQVYGDRDRECFPGRTGNGVQKRASEVPATSKVIGYRPTCSCNAEDPAPCRVLDPFSGTGTTGQTACFLGHDYVGIELNPDYAAHSDKWINMEPRWSKRKNLVASTRKNTMSQANQLSLFS